MCAAQARREAEEKLLALQVASAAMAGGEEYTRVRKMLLDLIEPPAPSDGR